MKSVFLFVFALFSIALVSCGGGGPKNHAVEVSGYLCNGCKTQFYTTDGVQPSYCPQCKEANMVDVSTYVCPSDQQKTIAPRSREGVPCKQCKTMVENSSYPTEEDLKAWGATAKTKAEVGS